MSRAPLRVIVVDDHDLFRAGLAAILNTADGIEVVGQAAGGRRATILADELAPDVVLMDINMPDMNGIEATRRIVSAHPDVVVFLCSTYDVSDLPPALPRAAPAPTCTRKASAPRRCGGCGGTGIPAVSPHRNARPVSAIPLRRRGR